MPFKSLAAKRQWRKKYRDKLRGAAPRAMPAVCEVCSGPPGTGRDKLDFDHCHARNVFRGWLCNKCNRTLGNVNDDPTWLRKLADYLEDFALRQ